MSSIGLAAFVEGLSESSLTEIKVDPENPYFLKRRSGIQQGWHKTDRVSVRTFRRLPDPGWNCKRRRLCFYYCVNVSSITVPGSVRSLGEGAFGNCSSLTKAVLNEGLEEIGEYAFQSSSGIRDIIIPASVKSVGKNGLCLSSGCRIRVLSTDTVWADDAFRDLALIAGKRIPHFRNTQRTMAARLWSCQQTTGYRFRMNGLNRSLQNMNIMEKP